MNNQTFQPLTANIDTTQAKIKTYKKRQYYVAPVTMIAAPIVMNDLLYSVDEVSKFPGAWNGRPVTLFHPKGSDGDYISANDESVAEDVHLGILRNTKFTDEAKLIAEAWVDIEHTRTTRPEVLEYYEGKKQGLEVSTGLWGDIQTVSGELDGVKYSGVMTNFRPDHLALLPGGEGACNWEDGCGLRANDDAKGFARLFDNSMSDKEVQQAVRTAFDPIRSKDKDYYIEAIYQKEGKVVYEEIKYGPDGSGSSKLYKRSFTIDKNGVATLGQDAEEVKRKLTYEPIKKNDKEISTMSDKIKAKVDGLIACKRCRFEEKDREWLMTLNEEQLELVTPPDNVVVLEEPKPNQQQPKNEDSKPDQQQPITAESWLMNQKDMPKEVADTILEGLAHNHLLRAELIENISKNPRNKFTVEQLQTMNTNTLKNLSALADDPKPDTNQQPQGFFGMKPFTNLGQDQKPKDPEPLVVQSLAEACKESRKR